MGAIAIAIYLRSAKRISIPAMGGNRKIVTPSGMEGGINPRDGGQ